MKRKAFFFGRGGEKAREREKSGRMSCLVCDNNRVMLRRAGVSKFELTLIDDASDESIFEPVEILVEDMVDGAYVFVFDFQVFPLDSTSDGMLENRGRYFGSIKAFDRAGNISPGLDSPKILVDVSTPSPSKCVGLCVAKTKQASKQASKQTSRNNDAMLVQLALNMTQIPRSPPPATSRSKHRPRTELSAPSP